MKWLETAFLAFTLCGLPACGAEFGDEASDVAAGEEVNSAAEAVLGGQATFRHPQVLMLSAGANMRCSGVLISSNYFLTAAHCWDEGIDTLTAHGPDGSLVVNKAVQWLLPLTDPPEEIPTIADLALGRVDDMPSNWAVARMIPRPSNGAEATIIGYGGNLSSDCTDSATGAGIKRFRTGKLGSMPWSCKGDSGGAWHKGAIDGTPDLFGITSGSPQVFTNPAAYADMITGFMRGEEGGFEFGIDRPLSDLRSFTTGMRSVCRLECEKDAACVAFTLDGTRNICFLKSSAPAPGPSAGGRTVVSGLSVGMGAFDVPGNNLRSLTRSSADACRLECARDSQCKAYTWVTESQTCFIKNARPAAVACPAGITCTSGYRHTQTPPSPPPLPPPPCGGCPVEPAFAPHWQSNLDYGTDRPGGDLPNMPIQMNAIQGCADACERNSQCKTWTFVSHAVSPGNPLCYLKSSDRAPVVSAATRGLISGQKGRRHF
jgi:hypothetical protein